MILAWMVAWEETQVMDVAAHIFISPRVSLDYVAWWIGVQLGDIGLGEDDNSYEETTSEGSNEDDPYQVNNPIHDVPIKKGKGAGGLAILFIATQIAALGKMLT